MPSPFVSVLIDTYNHDRYIEEAVTRVLAQDFPSGDREIRVVDDGSTDKTPNLLRKFEPHVRILRKANGGQASAFNLGIPACGGEIVVVLDGDDWWTPNKLSKVVEAFSSSPTIGLVGHSITEALPNGVLRTELVRDSPRRSFSGADRCREAPRKRCSPFRPRIDLHSAGQRHRRDFLWFARHCLMQAAKPPLPLPKPAWS